jgi:hypothetical protein
MTYTLKIAHEPHLGNADYDPRTAPVVGTFSTVAACRAAAAARNVPGAEYRITRGNALVRWIKADGRNL